jgi:hypothetical protein
MSFNLNRNPAVRGGRVSKRVKHRKVVVIKPQSGFDKVCDTVSEHVSEVSLGLIVVALIALAVAVFIRLFHMVGR